MNKRILLIGGNYYPEPTGIGKYSGEMINWLSNNGFECTVITTFPYYPHWKVQEQYSKYRFWFKKEIKQSAKAGSKPITIIRCPHYIPTTPTGMKRLLSEFTISFFCYLALFSVLFTKRFSYVISVAPPFELGLLGVLYKKIRGTIFLYHIQDLQIDAARELGMIKSPVIIKVLSGIEKYIIKQADYVSTISQGMIKKVKLKCNKEVTFLPNWVDTKSFHPIANKAGLKEEFGFKSTDRIILYSGAIGEKQGLGSVLHVAKHFEKFEDVKFVISGSGPYKGHLVDLKESIGLNNVTFLSLQPCEKLNSFLNMADFHLVLQKANASDLVMPSKLTTILAVGGIAIVTANPGTSLFEVMHSMDMGLVIEPENQEALKNAIEEALIIEPGTKEFNARAYAEKNFSIDKILSRFATNVLNDKIQVKRKALKKEEVALEQVELYNH